MNRKYATPLSSSEMQLRLALAMVILGFEERVDKQTRELLELEQAMQHLSRQREALQEQREKDTEYLAASMRHLYPEVSLRISEEGRVEIPAGVLQQLQHLQQAQLQPLAAPTGLLVRGQALDEQMSAERAVAPAETPEALPPTAIAGEADEETAIDPRAKAVLVYLFSQPPASMLDWRTTVQRALELPDPPKLRSHQVYKALQQAYRILENLHDGTLPHPSTLLMTFYTQYFIEGERWGEYKDTMNEWGIV
jgi:hypothetical protein